MQYSVTCVNRDRSRLFKTKIHKLRMCIVLKRVEAGADKAKRNWGSWRKMIQSDVNFLCVYFSLLHTVTQCLLTVILDSFCACYLRCNYKDIFLSQERSIFFLLFMKLQWFLFDSFFFAFLNSCCVFGYWHYWCDTLVFINKFKCTFAQNSELSFLFSF